MIQRIQTIFLLLTAILMGIVLFFPLCEVVDNNNILFSIHSYGIKEILEGNEGNLFKMFWGGLIFSVLSILTPLISVLLYKNRNKQARITLLNVLFIVLHYVTVVTYTCSFVHKIDSEDANIQINVTSLIIILPLVALITNILAYLRIRKDEKLVRSLDRIR